MKKLIMAAAIVCAAAISQAATCSWQLQGLKGTDGAALTAGYVYTFCTKGDNATTVAAVQAALVAVEGQGADAFAQALSGFTAVEDLSGTLTGAGKLDIQGVDLEGAGIPQSTSGTRLFAVVLDTETLTDDSNWYITQTTASVKTPGYASASNAGFTLTDAGSATAANWHAVSDIPEPTSGLLLLLGMAGLALRRRRA